MGILSGKIDFMAVISVTNANPNGDPLNGNRPRENYEGYGEISDVCIKRKIRNRFQDLGHKVFVQSDERADDGYKSLKDRADSCAELKSEIGKKNPSKEQYSEIACKEWIDVRTFGQVFAFKGSSVSVGVRGPVSIHQSISVSPIDTISMQITKSVNSESGKDNKASDTMGMKHRVEFGLYVIKGSINCQLAEKTGFSDEDAEILKEALKTLFENDSSSARPEGSMEVVKLFWFKHKEKTPKLSTAKIHRSLKLIQKTDIMPKSAYDYDIYLEGIEDIEPEVYSFV